MTATVLVSQICIIHVWLYSCWLHSIIQCSAATDQEPSSADHMVIQLMGVPAMSAACSMISQSGPATLSCSTDRSYKLLGRQLWAALPSEKSRSPAMVNKVSKWCHTSYETFICSRPRYRVLLVLQVSTLTFSVHRKTDVTEWMTHKQTNKQTNKLLYTSAHCLRKSSLKISWLALVEKKYIPLEKKKK